MCEFALPDTMHSAKHLILFSTFELQCTSLTMYTVVNGSTVIVCKLNDFNKYSNN